MRLLYVPHGLRRLRREHCADSKAIRIWPNCAMYAGSAEAALQDFLDSYYTGRSDMSGICCRSVGVRIQIAPATMKYQC